MRKQIFIRAVVPEYTSLALAVEDPMGVVPIRRSILEEEQPEANRISSAVGLLIKTVVVDLLFF